MNEKNLIPQAHKLTVEEQSKAGKKSQQIQKQRKKMKETMQLLLNLQVPTEEAKEKLMEIGIPEEDATLQSAILYKQVAKEYGIKILDSDFIEEMEQQ